MVHIIFRYLGNNPFICDCRFDWYRQKWWFGQSISKAGLDIYMVTFTQPTADKEVTKCAGPNIFTGGFPPFFETLCGNFPSCL